MTTGFNMPWFFNQFRNGNYFCPEGVLTQIKALKPGILRFGGTISNYYDFNGMGYGFEQTQAKCQSL